MADIDDLMKRHSVSRAGCMYFGGSVCCWVNREAPAICFWTPKCELPKETVIAGKNGWRVGWAPTLPEAFMIALMSQRLEKGRC